MSMHEDLDFSTEYNGLDFFNIDSQLTDEERMVRDTVRAWVESRFLS